MPSERTRSKDDTWTTDELNKALKGEKKKHRGTDEERPRRRDDDDGRSERRRHRDDINGDTEHRKKRSDESDRRRRRRDEEDGEGKLTEEERERQRRERREKREKDSGSTTRKREDKKSHHDRIEEEPETKERRRHHRDEDADRERRRHDDDGKKHRSGRDDDERRKHRDGDEDRRKSKHRDDDDHRRRREDDDRRRDRDDDDRRKHRDEGDRKKRDDGDRRRHREDDEKKRHRDDDDRRRHKDDDDRRRHRDDDDKRRHRDDDEKRRHRDDDDKRRKHKDDDEKRRHRDEDDKRRRHRDEDDDDKERRRRREERREEREKGRSKTEDDDRRKRREDRHRDEEQDDEERERRRQERRERREKKEEKDKKPKGEDRREEKRYERTEEDEPRKREEPAAEEEEEAEPEYEEDFEDYEDDFEEYEPEGEVEEVLRALDEENNRLLSASHRSNWSDSTDLSDERFQSPRKTRDADRDDQPARKPRPVGGIFNFISAKQRVMSKKLMGKTQKRATDLAKIIELDVAKYDIFDLPPVREYDLYIRNFGSANTKQAYVQTNEDNIEREIQTEEIDSHEKWTQHPADDLKVCGGDGIDNTSEVQSTEATVGETSRLSQFLGKTGQIVGILMEEEKKDFDADAVAGQKANVSWSSGYFELGIPHILSGRMVKEACFCPGQPNMLLTINSAPTQGPNFSRRGLLCAWNINDPAIPHRVLACEAHPSCCCFSPTKASLAFAGMRDGSVVAWDLREPNFMHHKVELEGEEVVVRYPTYNTARVLEEENHLSPVMAVMPVYSVSASSKAGAGDASDMSGLSFQLATLEENGVINLWVVVEIPAPDTAGSQVDLGLAPGGRVKLVKSSKIILDSPAKDIGLRSSLHTFDLQLKPDDLNHYYVGTDMGHVIHGVRFGSRPFPRSHMPANGAPLQIHSIDFSPFGCPYFLAGCDDGSVLLFHTQLEKAIFSWPPASPGRSVLCVRWSTSRPAVFFVLDSSSTVIVYDLVEAEMVAVKNDRIKSGKVVSIALSPDLRKAEVGSNPHPPQLFLSLENGATEIHTISKQYTEPQTLELEYLENYVDKF